MPVEFEDNQWNADKAERLGSSMPADATKSKFISWLVDRGVVHNAAEANFVLVAFAVLCIGLTGFMMYKISQGPPTHGKGTVEVVFDTQPNP